MFPLGSNGLKISKTSFSVIPETFLPSNFVMQTKIGSFTMQEHNMFPLGSDELK